MVVAEQAPVVAAPDPMVAEKDPVAVQQQFLSMRNPGRTSYSVHRCIFRTISSNGLRTSGAERQTSHQ